MNTGVPSMFKMALAKDKQALEHFSNLTLSKQKEIIENSYNFSGNISEYVKNITKIT